VCVFAIFELLCIYYLIFVLISVNYHLSTIKNKDDDKEGDGKSVEFMRHIIYFLFQRSKPVTPLLSTPELLPTTRAVNSRRSLSFLYAIDDY